MTRNYYHFEYEDYRNDDCDKEKENNQDKELDQLKTHLALTVTHSFLSTEKKSTEIQRITKEIKDQGGKIDVILPDGKNLIQHAQTSRQNKILKILEKNKNVTFCKTIDDSEQEACFCAIS